MRNGTHTTLNSSTKNLINLEQTHGREFQRDCQKLKVSTTQKPHFSLLLSSRSSPIYRLKVNQLSSKWQSQLPLRLPRLTSGPARSTSPSMLAHLNLKTIWANSWQLPQLPSSTGSTRSPSSKDTLSFSTDFDPTVENVNFTMIYWTY